MEKINEKDAAKLAAMIYRPELAKEWKALLDEEEIETCTVSELVKRIEANLAKQSPEGYYGAEMSKDEYWDVITQIKESETLMSMEIVDLTTTDETYFRAMTLVDPNNKVDPVIVLRGTAGNYQWDDNFAAIYSSCTPSQQEALQYVIKQGYDHVTLAGHSKAGSMAAFVAYLLPEGMVDKVYSFDGQGLSDVALSMVSEDKQEFAKGLVYNINEYRDMVNQLLNKTGLDENSTYFDSGIDFKNSPSTGLKMYLFHAHKPNYFLAKGVRIIGRSFVPVGAIHAISGVDFRYLSSEDAIKLAKKVASALHGDEEYDTSWGDDLWNAVAEAERVYRKVNRKRANAILRKLTHLYQMDFSNYMLIQDPGSYVVEGAILTCPHCNGVGTLENIETHGHLVQGKPVASKKDNIEGKNIIMEDLKCSIIDFQGQELKVESQICQPEICDEWVITDANKKLYIDGEQVDAVLKKSALGCLRGSMIEIVHNGQINMEDIKKIDNEENTEAESYKISKVEVFKEYNKAAFDLYVDISGTAWNAVDHLRISIENKTKQGLKQVGNAVVEPVKQGWQQATEGFERGVEDIANQIESAKEQCIRNIINDKLKYH